MLLLPHTALLALVLALLGYDAPLYPARATEKSTCSVFDHPATYFDTCAAYYNTSSAPSPLFGSVEHLDGHSAFALIQAAAPPPPPLPSFSSLSFLTLLTANSSSSSFSSSYSNSSQYHLLLLHTSIDPFSLHLLPQFHWLARRFPRIRFLAVDCEGEDVYAFHRLINTSVTLPFPFLSPTASTPPTPDATSPSTASYWWLWWSRLRSLLSLSSWWTAAPPLPPSPATAPSLSFSSHYLVRGLPTLLLFHSSTVQQPNVRWPRSLAQLTQRIVQATSQQPEVLDDEVEEEEEMGAVVQEAAGAAEDEQKEEDDHLEDEMSELDELFGVTSELDYGLLWAVMGLTVVHCLHRLKDKLDRWEVEAMAVQHVAM